MAFLSQKSSFLASQVLDLKDHFSASLKPGLHMVVRVAEHACDDALKRILKPSTNQLQIFLVRDQYLRSLLPHGDQTIAVQLENMFSSLCLLFLRLIWRPGLTFLVPIGRIKGVVNFNS